jgi:hypothetical protein
MIEESRSGSGFIPLTNVLDPDPWCPKNTEMKDPDTDPDSQHWIMGFIQCSSSGIFLLGSISRAFRIRIQSLESRIQSLESKSRFFKFRPRALNQKLIFSSSFYYCRVSLNINETSNNLGKTVLSFPFMFWKWKGPPSAIWYWFEKPTTLALRQNRSRL